MVDCEHQHNHWPKVVDDGSEYKRRTVERSLSNNKDSFVWSHSRNDCSSGKNDHILDYNLLKIRYEIRSKRSEHTNKRWKMREVMKKKMI